MRYVVITGASSGIGKAISEKFSGCGDEVTNISRTRNEDVFNVTCDLSSEAQLQKMFTDSRVDVLINCAGIMPLLHFDKVDMDVYNRIMNVNVRAPYFLCRNIIPQMPSGGKVVNIASISGFANDDPDLVAYAMSKAAVIMLTRCLAKLYPHLNINSVSPGLTRGTNLVPGEPEPPQDLIDKIPMKRPAEPEEIAELVYFLCSENAKYITGANIVIDGGQTA